MTIYVITAHAFNHSPELKNRSPLDDRFIKSDRNYVYYLIDREIPKALEGKKCLLEHQIDPALAKAGKEFLGEWAFLLAEAKHSFCEYPFFMISSRFYQKNSWLQADLNREWETLFKYLKEYGWGYLPSYDQPLYWVPLAWEKKIKRKVSRYKFFPFTKETFSLIQNLYKVEIPKQWKYTSYLFCNYIGFQTRQHLLDYVNFYKPLIDTVFDENFQPKMDLSTLALKTGEFRNEKPFTFVLEWFSHLFFHKKERKFFALHYDGYYEVDENRFRLKKLESFRVHFRVRIQRWLSWKWRYAKSEGILAPIRPTIQNFKKKLGFL